MTLTLDKEPEVKVISQQKTKRIFVMDAGERLNTVKVYDSYTDKLHILKFTEFLQILDNNSFDEISFDKHDEIVVISELAHWVIQTEYSYAQVFTEEQSQYLINAANSNEKFKIYAWPEKLTTSALRYANESKDQGDCKAICHWLTTLGGFKNLKKVRKIEDIKPSPIVLLGNEWRKEVTNKDLNKAQKVNYGLPKKQDTAFMDLNLCPVMRDIILPNWSFFQNLSPQLRKLWKIDIPKDKKTLDKFPNAYTHIKEYRELIWVKETRDGKEVVVKDWFPLMKAIYACVNGLFDYDCELRLDPRPERSGKLVSNNWLHDHYYCEKPHHQMSGVARAIKYHYAFPMYIKTIWNEKHGEGSWPSYTATQGYKSPEGGGWKKHNRGSLSIEQMDFMIYHRNDIRRREKHEVINVLRNKYL